MIDLRQVRAAIEFLNEQGITASELFTGLLQPDLEENSCATNLLQCSSHILSAFLDHPASVTSTVAWAHSILKCNYLNCLKRLTQKESGWHFGASNALVKQLETFQIEDIATSMHACAPDLWELLSVLLQHDLSCPEYGCQDPALLAISRP